VYAILRAAFMSDEPVRGAPSIDAFSVEKVENETWRAFDVLSLFLFPSFSPLSLCLSASLSLVALPDLPSRSSRFLAYPRLSSLPLDHRIRRWHTLLSHGGRFDLRACHLGIYDSPVIVVARGLFCPVNLADREINISDPRRNRRAFYLEYGSNL